MTASPARRRAAAIAGVAVSSVVVLTGCSGGTAQPAATVPVTSAPEESTSATTETAALGETVEVAGRSLTVYEVVNPFPSDTFVKPDKNKQFAVADIQACSLDKAETFSVFDWTLDDVDGRNWTFYDSSTSAREPDVAQALGVGDKIPANTCRRGWLTFEIDKGTTVKTVSYTGKNYSGDIYGQAQWAAE